MLTKMAEDGGKKMRTGSAEQEAVLLRFEAACQGDERVVAAFLGGSFARGAADVYSDLDIYLVTNDEDYDSFFAERHAFMRQLGEPVFLEDFNQFGFDMMIFTYADGVQGELAMERESNFEHIHGGPYKILIDKKGLLVGKVFPLLAPTEAQQLLTLRHLIYWFWEDLSNFIVSMNREHYWPAYSSLDEMRLKCVNLAHLVHDFTAEAGGYANVEQDLTPEQRQALEATFCSLEPRALLDAVQVVLRVYQEMAPPLAAKRGAEYPAEVERVLSERLGRLVKKLASAAASKRATG
jgi:predicted nucleotidyltransferase